MSKRLSDDENQMSMLKGENERLTKCVEDLGEEKEAWKRCADAFNEATAGVTIGKMAHEHERQLLEAFRQYALLTKEGT